MSEDLPEPPRSLGELVVWTPPGPPTRRVRGRFETRYTQAIGLEICLLLSTGKTLRRICMQEGMPKYRTVMDWLHYAKDLTPELKEFRRMHHRARIAQMHAWSDEIIDIADDGSNDWMEEELESGRIIERLNHEHVARSKIRIDTRLRLMGVVARHAFGSQPPKDYDNDAPGAVVSPEGQLTEIEKARRIAFLLGRNNEFRDPSKKTAGERVEERAMAHGVDPATAYAAGRKIDAEGAVDHDPDDDWMGEA